MFCKSDHNIFLLSYTRNSICLVPFVEKVYHLAYSPAQSDTVAMLIKLKLSSNRRCCVPTFFSGLCLGTHLVCSSLATADPSRLYSVGWDWASGIEQTVSDTLLGSAPRQVIEHHLLHTRISLMRGLVGTGSL